MKVKISNSPTQNELEEIDLSSTTKRGHDCVVGRSADSDVVLDSDDVSRLHGKFFYQSGNYYFCDLGSRNGTIINGKVLEKNHSHILNDGDIIRIGDFALMLEEDMSFSQQSETVVRIINPSMFSSLQRNQNDRVSEVDSPVSQSVNQLEESAKSFVSEAVANRSDEVENAQKINKNSEEPTFVQPDEEITENSVEFDQENQINEISNTPVEAIENISSTEPEYTIVQPRDIFDENSDENDNDSTQLETQEDNSELNLEENTEPQAKGEQEIASQSEESTETEVESEQEETETDEQDIAQTSEESETTEAENGMIEVTNNEYIDSEMANTEEVEEASMSEIASISASESATAQEDEVAQETEESDKEEEFIKIAPVLEEKRIVLISHDTKKSELKELISEHEEFLSYCQTITWQTYNDYLYRQTGLSVTEDIPPATSGGYQAINSLINSEKIIAVIFIRDLTVPQQGQASEEALLRTCNIREILLANNLPTAQAVIHYLKNMGDS